MTTLDTLENLKEKSLNYMKLEARRSKTHFAVLFSVFWSLGLVFDLSLPMFPLTWSGIGSTPLFKFFFLILNVVNCRIRLIGLVII